MDEDIEREQTDFASLDEHEFGELFHCETGLVTHEFFGRVDIQIGRWQGEWVAWKSGRWVTRCESDLLAEIGRRLPDEPGIMHLLHCFDEHSYVMQAVPKGFTLCHYIKQCNNDREPLAFRDVVNGLRQLAATLARLHELNIIHHDMKPENIVLDFQPPLRLPVPRLCDFGSAEQLNAQGLGDPERRGEGTDHYRAPEQVRAVSDSDDPDSSSTAVTTAIDVWGFGKVAWAWLMAGRSTASALDFPVFLMEQVIDACQEEDWRRRPSMQHVCTILADERCWDQSQTYAVQMKQQEEKCRSMERFLVEQLQKFPNNPVSSQQADEHSENCKVCDAGDQDCSESTTQELKMHLQEQLEEVRACLTKINKQHEFTAQLERLHL